MTELKTNSHSKKGPGLTLLFLLFLFLAAGIVYFFIFKEEDAADGDLAAKASADYEMQVNLYNGMLQVEAEIEVTNASQEDWTEIGFNFIPNALHERGISVMLANSMETRMISVSDSEELFYQLTDNRLLVQLREPLAPGETKKLAVHYVLRNLSYDNSHLTAEDDLFFAHWYPEIARYDNGWAVPDLSLLGDVEYPTYSDFTIHYQLDEPRLVISSAVDGDMEASASGTLKSEKTTDFFIGFLEPAKWKGETTRVEDTEIRFFTLQETELSEEVVQMASDSFAFFEENIGSYPAEEVDFLSVYMNGPTSNVVAMGEPPIEANGISRAVAGFWFREAVLSDPHTDAWLSTSIPAYLGSAYLTERFGNEDEAFAFETENDSWETESTSHYANAPIEELDEWSYGETLYGRTVNVLRSFFNNKGGEDAAFRFFSAYYKEYQGQQTDSQTFAAFLEEYYEGDQSEWLETWLDLEQE